MENSYLHYKSFFLSQHPQYIDIHTLSVKAFFIDAVSHHLQQE